MSRQARILVIDDEPIVVESCKRVLQREGMEVEGVLRGREAIERAGETVYDAILLDMRMPDMDGMEVLRRLRERNPKALIIILTGYPSIDNAVEALKLGAQDYVPKPFVPDALVTTVKATLARKREQEQEAAAREADASADKRGFTFPAIKGEETAEYDMPQSGVSTFHWGSSAFCHVPVAGELVSRPTITLHPSQTICEAVAALTHHDIPAAPVVDDEGELAGVLTEKDCIRVCSSQLYNECRGGTVEAHMSPVKAALKADMDIFQVASAFVNTHFSALPVFAGKRYLGLLTRLALLRGLQTLCSGWETHREQARKFVEESLSEHPSMQHKRLEAVTQSKHRLDTRP